MDHILFEVLTPLGFYVRTTQGYWVLIATVKHPVMQSREKDVELTLRMPDQVRRSRRDQTVYLFYRLEKRGRWICAVVKRLNDQGFLVTAYLTDAVKEGEQIWTR